MSKWLLIVAVVGCSTSYDRVRRQATDEPAAGMAVVDPSGGIQRPLGPVVTEALEWWAGRYPGRAAEIRSYVGRGSILVVVKADCPMPSDPWYPPQRLVWAETRDNVTRVCWSPETDDSFDRRLQHEVGHMAASVLRLERAGRDDHTFMTSIGYPWD